MTPNFQALCYLTAWEMGLPLEGGMAWESQLRKCRLDYSWRSLDRIDLFLDALRTQRSPVHDEFISDQSNINLLIFLAFYVVELRSRVSGQPSRWLTYKEAVEQDHRAEAYGQGFHSILIAEQGDSQFLPLVSICVRLFESNPDKSVAFSAGIHIKTPVDKHRCFEKLAPTEIIKNFHERYLALDIPVGYKKWIEAPIPPGMPLSDPLVRLGTDAPILLSTGYVVWGAVVQANNNLFDPSFYGAAPGDVVYDPQGRVDRIDLYHIACRLLELKDEKQTDPALEYYGNHLREETTRVFGWRTPQSLYPYELRASTTIFMSEVNFPGYAMVSPLIPILVSNECPGSVIIAPWQLWPKEIFEDWNDKLFSKFGGNARIHNQPLEKAIPVLSPADSTSVELETNKLIDNPPIKTMSRVISFERNKSGYLAIIISNICILALIIYTTFGASNILKDGSHLSHPFVNLLINNPTLLHAVVAVAIIAFASMLIHTGKDYYDKTPGLLLNSEGLTDAHYDYKEPLGPIPWSEIVNFKIYSNHNRQNLVVELNDPEKYLHVGTKNRRMNSQRHMDEYGSPVVISSRYIKSDIRRVKILCDDLLSAHNKERNIIA